MNVNDYSQNKAYSLRAMVTGWVEDDGNVFEVQGFYCPNGPEVGNGLNVSNHDGVIGSGPENDHPYYFVPECGYSTSRDNLHATREEAVVKARENLLRQQAAIASQLAAL